MAQVDVYHFLLGVVWISFGIMLMLDNTRQFDVIFGFILIIIGIIFILSAIPKVKSSLQFMIW